MIAFTNPVQSKVGEVNILLLVAVFFGFGMLVFAALSLMLGGQAQTARSTLVSHEKASYSRGQDDQKDEDAKAALAVAESPYSVYSTPSLFGSFEVHYPKNWSAYAVESYGASTQIDTTFHPDVIRTKAYGSKDEAYAAHVQLLKTTYDVLKKEYDARIKTDKLTTKSVTVSGITGVMYTGKYDRAHNGVAVLLPVRDKTLVIATDDIKYVNEFNQILAQSKINP